MSWQWQVMWHISQPTAMFKNGLTQRPMGWAMEALKNEFVVIAAGKFSSWQPQLFLSHTRNFLIFLCFCYSSFVTVASTCNTTNIKHSHLMVNFQQSQATNYWKSRHEDLHICWIHTHTRAHLMALFPGLPGSAGTRKAKTIWILLKQETVSDSGISSAICKPAPRSRQTTTPAPHRSVFYRLDALPATQPTASKHWRDNICWIVYTKNSKHLLASTNLSYSLQHKTCWETVITSMPDLCLLSA